MTGSMLFNPDLKSEKVISEVRETIGRVTRRDYWLREHLPESEIPWFDQLKEPVNISPDHEGCQTLYRACQQVMKEDPKVTCGRFVADANYWHQERRDTILFGPGNIEMGCPMVQMNSSQLMK